MAIEQQIQATTSVAVAWTIEAGSDDWNCKRIALLFDAAPTTDEDITVTLDAAAGAAYDTVLLTVSPVGKTSIVLEDIGGFDDADKLLVSYANTDLNAIVGTANIEVGI